uniref:ABC transporter domain-containing protein n=1 Tax=Timema genevievae TaxID=629358 RepID=A0A7R9JQU4_TIMGE|nr:unnamed protein product [Timema genevievae]
MGEERGGSSSSGGGSDTCRRESILATEPLQQVAEKQKINMLSHLPELPRLDIEFSELLYTVPEGRKGKLRPSLEIVYELRPGFMKHTYELRPTHLRERERGNKTILRNVSGYFRSGQLTAILGPSGAGKSTLLNILAGYKCLEVTGNISINGEPRDLRQFRRMSRYIMQEDLVQPFLTVQECILIAAHLKLGNALDMADKIQAIEEILSMLRLVGARNTQTCLLSGGEKKRLSIALEMVNNPPIIFLDEPTTGLDDLSSTQCISLLKMLAEGGRTVVCSVHTPSARLFSMFDHVYIVAEGQCVFQGAGSNIVPYLSLLGMCCPIHYNPADFMLEVSSGEYGNHIEKMVNAVDNGRCYRWEDKDASSQTLGLPLHGQQEFESRQDYKNNIYNLNISTWKQFQILAYRMFLQSWRNKSFMYLNASMYIFLSFVIGGLFWQIGHDGSRSLYNFGFCYNCNVIFMFVPLLPALQQYPTEVKTLQREYFNRWYSLKAYFFAMTITRLPQQIIFGTIFCALTYVMTDQPLELHRCLQFWLICLLIGAVSDAIGVAIGSILNVVNSMFVGPSFCVPMMLLGVYDMGTGIKGIPLLVRIAMHLSYIRYGLEGLVLSLYGYDRARSNCPKEEVYCHFSDPRVLLQDMGMENCEYWIDLIGLAVSFLVAKTIAYVFLRWRLTMRRSYPMITHIGRCIKMYFNITQSR